MSDTGNASAPEDSVIRIAASDGGTPGRLIDGLAHLPEKAILDEAQLAAILSLNPRTVRRMASRGELPPGVRFAGRKVWLAGRVLRHIEDAAERAEREAERRLAKIRQLSP